MIVGPDAVLVGGPLPTTGERFAVILQIQLVIHPIGSVMIRLLIQTALPATGERGCGIWTV